MFSISPEELSQADQRRCCSRTWWRPCCTSSLASSTPLASASAKYLLKSTSESFAGNQRSFSRLRTQYPKLVNSVHKNVTISTKNCHENFTSPACNSQSHLGHFLPPSSQHSGGEVEMPKNLRQNSFRFLVPFWPGKLRQNIFRFPILISLPTLPGGVQAAQAFPPPQHQEPQSGGCSRMRHCRQCTPKYSN